LDGTAADAEAEGTRIDEATGDEERLTEEEETEIDDADAEAEIEEDTTALVFL
jgi:hypothetical protein